MAGTASTSAPSERSVKRVVCAVVTAVLAGACGSGGEPAPAGDVDADGVWNLVRGESGAAAVPLVDGFPVTLEIEGGEISGTAACNAYGGPVEVSGSSFETGNLVVTEIGCARDVMESEERYLAALDAAETIAVDGDRLTLSGPDVELAFRRAPPVDTEALVGTTWVLESLVDGSTPEAVATSARRATLQLSADGTFEGTTGCRGFSGSWVEEGDRIVFTKMVFEGSCARGAAQDAHVVAVLGAGFGVDIEGRQVTLMAVRGGLGLIYDAR